MVNEMDFSYIHKTFDFKTRPNLSVNNKDMEAVTVEIVLNKNWKTLINIYCIKHHVVKLILRLVFEMTIETFLDSIYSQTKRPSETRHIAGDFNLNLHDMIKV